MTAQFVAPETGDITPRQLAALVSASSIGFTGLLFMPLWLSALAGPEGLGDATAGRLAFLHLATVAATIWFLAVRVDRVDRRQLAMVGAVLVLAANLASCLHPGLPLLAALRVASGLGEGLLLATMHAGAAASRRPDRLFAISNFVVILIAVLFYRLVTPQIAAYGVVPVFLTASVIALLGLPLLGWLQPRLAQGAQRKSGGTVGKQGAAGIVALAAFYIGEGALFAYLVQIGLNYGLVADAVGRIMSFGLAFGLLGPVVIGLVAGKIGMTAPFAVSLLALCGVALSYAYGSAESYALTTYAFNFIFIFAVTYSSALLAVLDPTGRLVALAPAVRTLGYAIGPLVGSFVVGQGHFALLGIVASVFYLISLVIFYPLARGADQAALTRPGRF